LKWTGNEVQLGLPQVHGASQDKTEEEKEKELVCLSYQSGLLGKCCAILVGSKAAF